MSANQNTVSTAGQTLRTSDATPAVIADYQTRHSKAYLVIARVVAVDVPLAQAAGYVRKATFFTTAAGVLAQVGSTTDGGTHESDANWDCGVAASGTEIQVTVTGEAAKEINWRCELDIIQVGLESYKT